MTEEEKVEKTVKDTKEEVKEELPKKEIGKEPQTKVVAPNGNDDGPGTEAKVDEGPKEGIQEEAAKDVETEEVKPEVPEPGSDETDIPEKDKKGSKEKKTKKKKSGKKESTEQAVIKEDETVKDPLEGFQIHTRQEVVDLLLKKHSDLKQKYEGELKGLDTKPPEIVQEKEEEKDIRDNINEEVQLLKGKRKELKDTNKKLREEFFDLLDREEKLKGHKKEVTMYSKFSKDLEWKLETEAITIETERRLLDDLRETMEKMRSITDGFTPQEIHSRLNEIQEEMGSNLMQIEDYHRQMLEKVGESNLHHGKFVDAKKQIRERESRRGWLKRRVELHIEMEKFWSGQKEQASKLDAEESSRDLAGIKDALLMLFKDRDDKKDDHDEPKDPKVKSSSKGKKRDQEPSEKDDNDKTKSPKGDREDEKAPKQEGAEKPEVKEEAQGPKEDVIPLKKETKEGGGP